MTSSRLTPPPTTSSSVRCLSKGSPAVAITVCTQGKSTSPLKCNSSFQIMDAQFGDDPPGCASLLTSTQNFPFEPWIVTLVTRESATISSKKVVHASICHRTRSPGCGRFVGSADKGSLQKIGARPERNGPVHQVAA